MKFHIQNRKGLKVVGDIIKPDGASRGLVFVEHGLGGFRTQDHIQMIAKAFVDTGYTVVNFDTTNSIGESEGKFENATTTQHLQDLEDVITWASSQDFYQEPFILSGHSLGGLAGLLYAEKNPEKVKALAPIGTVVSGKLSFDKHWEYAQQELLDWMESGWWTQASGSKPGVIKRLPWSHMVDRLKYDALKQTDRIKDKPLLLVVGDDDERCPVEHQRMLLGAFTGVKELHIIPATSHTPREPRQLEELYGIVKAWAQNLS